MTSADKDLLARARAALAKDDDRAALAAVSERLQADAKDTEALRLRGLLERRRGQAAEAQKTLAQVISIDPRADWAYNDLVRLLFEGGRAGDAERIARVALRVNPRNGEMHDLFGTILSDRNDLPSGEWHFRRALELAGPHPRIDANLGLNLMQQGRTAEAEACYRRASEAAPDDLQVLAHWSKLAEVQGDLPRAVELLDRAAAVASDADVNLLRARVRVREGRPADALALLEACEAMNGDGHLERGRIRDQLGRYDDAWSDFVTGKRQLADQAGGLEYRRDAVTAFFNGLMRFFVRANAELLPTAEPRTDVPQPVFVTGAPRSGTTLLGQILSSHPDVRAGGELPFVADFRVLANRLCPDDGSFPENLARTWTADGHYVATLFRDYYLARAAQTGLLDPDRRFFVDKMPFNEVYLPLIRMAFPQAAIIRIVRHPLDVCVSMMANNFTHGFNCGYRIADIAAHLAAIFDLTTHYRREFEPRELLLKYEDLVADQEGSTRNALEHAGLSFDDACLRFHENPRYAATPSYASVTEKLNDRSVGRHRHYAAYLEEFVPLLRPAMAAMAYEVAWTGSP